MSDKQPNNKLARDQGHKKTARQILASSQH